MNTYTKPNTTKKQRQRRRRLRLRARLRAMIAEEKQRRGCEVCKRHDLPLPSLHFHHFANHVQAKKAKVCRMFFDTISAVQSEMSKCTVMCGVTHHHYHRTGRLVHCELLRQAATNEGGGHER